MPLRGGASQAAAHEDDYHRQAALTRLETIDFESLGGAMAGCFGGIKVLSPLPSAGPDGFPLSTRLAVKPDRGTGRVEHGESLVLGPGGARGQPGEHLFERVVGVLVAGVFEPSHELVERGEGAPDDRWGFIPLVRRGGSMGVLAICCPETTFTPEDRATLETMVWQASQALERARLLESEAHSRQTLARVLAVSDAALEWLDSEDALHSLLQRIREAVGADSASLLVLEGDVLRVRATDGLDRIPEEQVPIPLGKGFSGRIAAERNPVMVEDGRIFIEIPDGPLPVNE